MDNWSSPGEKDTFTAPVGGVVSGTGYRIGKLFVVAEVSAAAGERFTGLISGVVSVAKVAAEPWTEGMAAYFNTGTGLASSVSSGTILIGAVMGSAVNPSSTGRVRLNGITILP